MPIPLRADFDAQMVRAAAETIEGWRASTAAFGFGGDLRRRNSHRGAAKIGGVTLQIVRDWVLKFNAHGPDGLIDRKPPGQAPRLNDTHRAALAAIIESGPIRPFMVSYDGGSSTSANGFTRNSVSWPPSRR